MNRSAPSRSTLRSLTTTMILQFAVGGALLPFLSIILRDRGFEDAQIASIVLASSSTLLVFPFLWGMLADRFIPMERLFTLLNVLAAGAMYWFANAEGFWANLIAYSAFFATFNPTLGLINALCFHHVDDSHRFAVIRSWGSAGWIIPAIPIFALMWYSQKAANDVSFVMPLTIGLALVTAVSTYFLPHTPPGGTHHHFDDGPEVPYWTAVKSLLTDGNYVTILASFFLMAGSFSLMVYYSPLLLTDIGLQKIWIGPIQVLGVVVEVILFRWKPAFIKNWTYHTSILFGCGALALRQWLFAVTSNLWLLIISYILAGLVIVFFHIAISLLVNIIARREVRATAQTMLVLLGSGLGPMAANWAAGRLATVYPDSLRPIFMLGAALSALAAFLILIRRRQLLAHG